MSLPLEELATALDLTRDRPDGFLKALEALACGIPLISAPWQDSEHLFTPGRDFLIARDEAEMTKLLRALLADKAMGRELAAHGLETILARHTCSHRVDELLGIYRSLVAEPAV